MQKDIKEFKQPKPDIFKSIPQVLFDIILSFSASRIGMLLVSKSVSHLFQTYWKNRITSDFKVTIDPLLPNLLTPFTVYPYYQRLSKTHEYQDGVRLGDPLLPAYIKSRCSENDLQKYTPQSLLEMAAVVGNGFMIQCLTDLQRGSDRAEVNCDSRVLENILKLDNERLLKLLISVAEEQKRPFGNEELILASNRFKAKSLVALWVDEPSSSEKMAYGKHMLDMAASAGNLAWFKQIIAKSWVPDQDTLKAAIRSGDLDLVEYLIENLSDLLTMPTVLVSLLFIAASFGHLNIFEKLVSENRWQQISIEARQEILKLAMNSRNAALVSLILSLGVNYNQMLLLEAAAQGHVQVMNSIMSGEVKPDEIKFNREVLNCAARSGSLDAVELVRSHGIDFDQETLNQAIRSGQLNLIVRVLARVKPNLDALRAAIVEGVQPIIEYLMTHFDFDELDLLTQINKLCDEAYVSGRIVESLISQLSKGRFKTTENKALLNSTATKLFNITAQLGYTQVVKLMLEEKTRGYLPFNPTQETLNSLARIGDESLVESLLVYQPNLQPTIETIQSAMLSGNRLLTKILIELVMKNTDDDPLLIAKTIFQTAVKENHLWLVQWLMAKDRGENRLIPMKSMILYAESIELPVPKIIAWLKEQLSYHLLFSFKLFSEILSFLPGIDQSKLAITSKEAEHSLKDMYKIGNIGNLR